ncbi:hypothetical protein F5Y11DRAFT_366165 [Daldinia sp. FL1419]|nr:hypothetical protein F5Y11DRAFT_366165 [Daldinia sp. FL1419]
MCQVNFLGSQVGGESVINYSYTDMPWKLVLWDLWYLIKYSPYLVWVLWPLWPFYGGTFDELSFTLSHVWCCFIHIILITLQLAFILALPSVAILPGWLFMSGMAIFFIINGILCRTLNGSTIQYTSDPKYSPDSEKFRHEQWIFLNGISTGESWLKDNLDRLALTFGRPILGIHNRTNGVIFDLLEVIVQRCFGYPTSDIRLAYKILKDKLYNPQLTTVIFILHSQGGIEGGLVIDWLLQEIPQDLLAKLEVYTFGNAANHFNNPYRYQKTQEATARTSLVLQNASERVTTLSDNVEKAADGNLGNPRPLTPRLSNEGPREGELHHGSFDRSIGHIEHYAHSSDFVARWGVLNFVTNSRASDEIPLFAGQLFVHQSRGGHLLNQHYLNDMFTLKKNAFGEFTGCADSNEFMDSVIKPPPQGECDNATQAIREDLGNGFKTPSRIFQVKPGGSVREKLYVMEVDALDGPVRVRDVSRLWEYRNGRKPRDKRGT